MNKKMFFDQIEKSLFNGRLSSGQRDGMEVKLRAFDAQGITDERWRAYMLATSYHETACAMQPVEEAGKGKGRPYGGKHRQDGTVYTYPDQLYYGRGDVQLTWYENYERMGKLLGIPLLLHPELALEPGISARIMIEGMTRGISNRGDFTGVSLEDYFNDRVDDPVNARKIVNGLDRAHRIAGVYRQFLVALKVAMVAMVLLFVGCKPAQVVTETIVTRTDSSAVQALRDSLYLRDRQVTLLQTDLQRAREENTHFKSNTRRHEIHYDTTAPVDSATGKQPVASETITEMCSQYEKVVEDDETRHLERAGARESLARGHRSLALAVDKQTHEDKTLKEKTAPRFNYWLFLAGVVVGIIVGVTGKKLLTG